ncbi:MAG: precorrin-2 dehydrogenase/sirohydrochlorin ferrochelatase [Moritella sp.]|jgi:precorrin-2 dehydrogenase/sirohydrochlorin ferrochelatase
MQYLPIFIDLNNKKVLVVGGGEVASRKVDLLLSANASVTVLSPRLNSTLQRYTDNGKITCILERYDPQYLANCMMVWVTTDDGSLNQKIWQDCRARNLLVNVADQPDLCEFITPSIIDRSPLQIAISSGGTSPVLIRYLREKLEALLPMSLGQLAAFAGEQRNTVKQQYATVTERRRFWERFFSSKAVEVATDNTQLKQEFEQQMSTPVAEQEGDIYLVQLPSEPELLTLKALRLMQQSDVIIYPTAGSSDAVESSLESFIELCRRDAERLPVDAAEQAQCALQRRAQGDRVCMLVADVELFTSLAADITAAVVLS